MSVLDFIVWAIVIVIALPFIGGSAGIAYAIWKAFQTETDRYFKTRR